MTLTYPTINRARRILWLVTGDEKAAMLVRLRDGDSSIPAGRVRQDDALVLADRAARRALAEPARPRDTVVPRRLSTRRRPRRGLVMTSACTPRVRPL